MADVTELKPSGGDPLAELATKIKAHHAAVKDAARNVVEKAIAAGTLLKEAKDKVGHGKFLPWLAENCDLSERTAENYMKIANNQHKLDAMKTAANANLTLARALRVIKEDKGNEGELGSMGKYEKAQATLIKKLRQLPAEDMADAAQRTIAELHETAATMKKR
jgi:Protein of unknown function (DUF3102)